jgi:hypothetical protein
MRLSAAPTKADFYGFTPEQCSLHWIILTGVGVGWNGLAWRWLRGVRFAPALRFSVIGRALPLGRDGGS